MTAGPLVVSLPTQALRDALGSPTGVHFVAWELTGPSPVAGFDMVVLPYGGDHENLRWLRGTRTRLVQSQSIGYDGIEELLGPGVVYANASSVHEASTAELALALILASQRQLDQYVRDAGAATWNPRPSHGLADRQVVVLGAGGVGNAVADRLMPFEINLSMVAREERDSGGRHIFGIGSLDEQLAAAEILVVCLPLTERTRGIIDERRLSLLPRNALIVNVGRGAVIDHEALVRHAVSGHIRIASDVFDPEPLPADHPFYSLDNVIVAPHVGGGTSAMLQRMAALVGAQLSQLAQGRPPLNVVAQT